MTLNIDDQLYWKAARLTGIREKTSLVKAGLENRYFITAARKRSMANVEIWPHGPLNLASNPCVAQGK